MSPANTGGAWSPIGDVTTIMLWVKGNVTTGPLISQLILPSIAAMLIPMAYVLFQLKGELAPISGEEVNRSLNTETNRRTILAMGIGALLFVPVFKQITHLLPNLSDPSDLPDPSDASDLSDLSDLSNLPNLPDLPDSSQNIDARDLFGRGRRFI